MNRLHRVYPLDLSEGAGEEWQGDVIFVHGLGGNWRETWQISGQPETFWPEWLGADLERFCIWSFGYDAAWSHWQKEQTPLKRRADNLCEWMETEEIGTRPLLFVCHGIGGLLVKDLLRECSRDERGLSLPLVKNMVGVVFLATPHLGADATLWTTYLHTMSHLEFPQEILEHHTHYLERLNDWYGQNAQALEVKSLSYGETQPDLHGMMVLDADAVSAHIPGGKLLPVDADHSSICKLSSREEAVYLGIRQFIQECIQEGDCSPS